MFEEINKYASTPELAAKLNKFYGRYIDYADNLGEAYLEALELAPYLSATDQEQLAKYASAVRAGGKAASAMLLYCLHVKFAFDAHIQPTLADLRKLRSQLGKHGVEFEHWDAKHYFAVDHACHSFAQIAEEDEQEFLKPTYMAFYEGKNYRRLEELVSAIAVVIARRSGGG